MVECAAIDAHCPLLHMFMFTISFVSSDSIALTSYGYKVHELRDYCHNTLSKLGIIYYFKLAPDFYIE